MSHRQRPLGLTPSCGEVQLSSKARVCGRPITAEIIGVEERRTLIVTFRPPVGLELLQAYSRTVVHEDVDRT